MIRRASHAPRSPPSVSHAPSQDLCVSRQTWLISGPPAVEDLPRDGRSGCNFCRRTSFSADEIGISISEALIPFGPAYKTPLGHECSLPLYPLSPPTVLHHYHVFRENPSRCFPDCSQPVGDDSAPQDTSRGPIQDKGRELLWSRTRNLLGLCGRSKASVRG